MTLQQTAKPYASKFYTARNKAVVGSESLHFVKLTVYQANIRLGVDDLKCKNFSSSNLQGVFNTPTKTRNCYASL